MSFADRLSAAVAEKKSITCVGIDPRKASLPRQIRDAVQEDDPAQWASAYVIFAQGIIDAVADLVPCVKLQAAFFEQLGPPGMIALAQTVQYAHQRDLLVIIDGKRNDIGSTAEAYADAYLGGSSVWGGDALTVSPYLGRDSLDPFVRVAIQRDAGIFTLVKTSNPGGGLLQDRVTDGQTVFAAVAGLVEDFNRQHVGSSGYGPVGAVVGATYPDQLAELRGVMPSAWLLIPGFGAQGGAAEDIRGGFDSRGGGAIVNSSRGIIFAYAAEPHRETFGDARWQDASRAATVLMNEQLATIRTGDVA